MLIEDAIRESLPAALGLPPPVRSVRLHGRNLCALYRVQLADGLEVAVKHTTSDQMARTEAAGLDAIRIAGARAPRVYGTCNLEGFALLCMEFVSGRATADRRQDLMRSLEQLYGTTNDRFGWGEDNFVGTLTQRNGTFEDFVEYWWTTRLLPQCELALRSERLSVKDRDRTQAVMIRAADEWHLHRAKPRLIHGDLWSGNILSAPEGAYLIDPSISWGHPEQDLAMLDLFGSPLPAADLAYLAERYGVGIGLPERIPFWQIYPLLVHVNLFGGSYVNSVRRALAAYE